MTASLGIRVVRSSLVDWWSMKKECRHARHRCILRIYFPNYEKFKYFVETITAYNQKLIFEEKLCIPMWIIFDTDQAQINSVIVWGGGGDHKVHNSRFLASISLRRKNQPWLVRVRVHTPTPFHSVYHHVQSCSERSSWVGRYAPSISSLPLYVLIVLCGGDSAG